MAGLDDLLKLAIRDAQEGANVLILCRSERERRRLMRQADDDLSFAPTLARIMVARTREYEVPDFVYWMQTPMDGASVVFGLVEQTQPGDLHNAVYWVWWPTVNGVFGRVKTAKWIEERATQPVPWRQHCMGGDPLVDDRTPRPEPSKPEVPVPTLWDRLSKDDP